MVIVAAVDSNTNWTIFSLMQLDFIVGAGCHQLHKFSVITFLITGIFLSVQLKRCVIIIIIIFLLFLGGCVNPVG